MRILRFIAPAVVVWVLRCAGQSSGTSADVVPEAAPEAACDTCDAADDAPAPDAGPACRYNATYLVPGPCEPGHDAALAAKALRYDRAWRVFNASGIGLNTDVSVAMANADDRALIQQFVQGGSGWQAEFESTAGRPVPQVLTAQHKVAGLYAGVGIVADAYRYGVLRDQGYPADEVARAATIWRFPTPMVASRFTAG